MWSKTILPSSPDTCSMPTIINDVHYYISHIQIKLFAIKVMILIDCYVHQ